MQRHGGFSSGSWACASAVGCMTCARPQQNMEIAQVSVDARAISTAIVLAGVVWPRLFLRLSFGRHPCVFPECLNICSGSRPGFGQFWPVWAFFLWSTLGKPCTCQTNIDRFGLSLAKFVPILSRTGQMLAKFGQHQPTSATPWHRLATQLPKSARIGRIWALQHLDNVWSSP